MPGPAALIALAARLGIKKAATYTYKQLQKQITKAQKKKNIKQTEAEKGYKGKGSKRKQEKVTQRKKVPQHGSVKQQENTIRRQRIKEEHTKRNLKEKIKAGNISKKEAVQIAKEHAAWSKLSIKDKWNLRSKIPQEERVSNFKKRK